MTTDLGRAAVERGDVLLVEQVGGGIVEIVARLPHLAAHARPGEFAQLRCGAGTTPLLRRPFSVAWTQDDTCTFILEAVGAGTRILTALQPGDSLDALGPLGSGFTLAAAPGTAVCVSGGLGCAPFPLLIRELRRRGVSDILVLNGARTAQRLYPADGFSRGDVAVRVAEATDDGSRGHHGPVTDLLPEVLAIRPAAVYACGPNVMLDAVMRTVAGAEPPLLEASLEAPMGCGFGTCLGCALPASPGAGGARWRLCCTDGPVMPMGDVDWAALRALPRAGRRMTPRTAATASVDLGRGLVLPGPVGLASGTAGYGFELRRLIDLDTLGALYTKGTTVAPREGNPPPRVAETPGGMLNSIGLQNPGVDWVIDRYAPQFREWRIPVIVNVAGATVDDYVECVRRMEGVAGIAGVELNISCPNIAHGLDFARDPDAAARLVAAVRAVSERSVMVKLSPNVTDIAVVARAVESAGADSVSAVNTYVGMKIHRASGRPVLPGGTGGLSGPAIQPLALAAVAAVCVAVRIPVVAVGGIVDAASARDFLTVGANAVQVGTATFVDPTTAIRVSEDLCAPSGRAAPRGSPG